MEGYYNSLCRNKFQIGCHLPFPQELSLEELTRMSKMATDTAMLLAFIFSTFLNKERREEDVRNYWVTLRRGEGTLI
jgi:hypothetical protein